MSDTILVSERGSANRKYRIITLSNPTERNALTASMRRELIAALRDADAAPDVRAVMLRGEGDASFCAGGSMTDLAGLHTREDCESMCREGTDVLNTAAELSKPLIAAVSGWCVGDGFELALCCDLIYASETARFTMPEVDLGLTLGWGGAVRLAKRANLIRTKEILMLGDRLSAADALELGIINRVLPAEGFFPAVEDILTTLSAKPPLALQGIKQLLALPVLDGSYAESQVFGGKLVADLMMTDDFHEAVSAFREKRTPEFHGR